MKKNREEQIEIARQLTEQAKKKIDDEHHVTYSDDGMFTIWDGPIPLECCEEAFGITKFINIKMVTRRIEDRAFKLIEDLRKANCHFVATAVRDAWLRGENTYIDSRVSINKKLRKEFESINNLFLE